MSQQAASRQQRLKVLPAYTRVSTLHEALCDPRSLRVLWLEILFNDQLDLAPVLDVPEGREAYQKACRWYTAFRSLIQFVTPRNPLPEDSGPIDQREYRTFAEALHFVSPDA
ncbi:MAG: hypothetical protein A3H49_05985 [Nitrospirae bacterium RIFCSPLOWO2_02_FULL_62_14]|nr:MAG: hypothetical protein A3H49_05985 [Nitrospirae bacterium RIFCSPLOWO2_02_FULL_62_14]OGW69175.1 MAG: hypothetical protein A3A88_07005 [Nitrospirae bacterium RIFCSPLOWO2_01_FULL_62_17]